MIKMKLKIMIMALLLVSAGIGSAVNRLPATEFVGGVDMNGNDISNWIGGDRERIVNYDMILKSIGTDLYAIHANGTILATGTTSDSGPVWNSGVDAIRSGSIGKMTVFIDAQALTTTVPHYCYSYMRVFGVGGGLPAIYTASDIPIFKCNDTGGSGNNVEILLQDLYLEYTGTAAYTAGHVELWTPNQCTLIRITTRTPNIISGGADNRGGIRLLSTASPNTVYSWLNRIYDCPTTSIEFENVSDSWVVDCDIYNGQHGNYSIRIGNNSHSLKILNNHIIAQNESGIAFLADNFNTIIRGNVFEPVMAVSKGLTEHGIFFDPGGEYNHIDISDNLMVGLGGVPLYLSNVRNSIISNNRLFTCNRNFDDGLAYIFLKADTEHKCRSNVVSGNIIRDDWNEATSNLGILEYNGIYDPNENLIHGNIVRGGAIDSPGITIIGADSETYDNIVLYSWDP
jgi:hypothetical protein